MEGGDPHPNPLPEGEGILGNSLPEGEGILGNSLPGERGFWGLLFARGDFGELSPRGRGDFGGALSSGERGFYVERSMGILDSSLRSE